MNAAVFAFEETQAQARALAACLDIASHDVCVRSFPDGESLVRVPSAARTALLFRSLDHPNAKLVEILLAASALRDGGAERVMLVAPYLAYMRQDMAFHPGEAVSQRVIGNLIAAHFDGLVTVDPHLHRIADLGEVIRGIDVLSLSAAPALAKAIEQGLREDTILVGPDIESRPWVESIAKPLGLEVLVGEKQRFGDRQVRLVLPHAGRARGRPAILVDDIISSGTTLLACAGLLRDAGATSVEAIATHCLASAADLAHLTANGIDRIRTSDTVPGSVAEISIAETLAGAIRGQGWIG